MKPPLRKVLFITGTDTGVGKTVLTIRLLRELRAAGIKAIALKPFCSGDREDARRIAEEMGGEKSIEEINPYYQSEPVAPGVRSLRNRGLGDPHLREILSKIWNTAQGYEWVLIVGVGGGDGPADQDADGD